VSLSRQPQATGCDKSVGSSSRQVAPPAREDQRMVRSCAVPRQVLPSRRDVRPVKPIPREGQRSGRRLPTSFMMAPTISTPTPCRGAGREGGRRTRRRRLARRWWRNQALPHGACSRCSSGAVEPWTFMCPLSPAGVTVQPRPLQRPGEQPPSAWERVLPLLRRQVEAEQPLRWRARSAHAPSRWARTVQPPSRARRVTW
jgi:hypothetical protein